MNGQMMRTDSLLPHYLQTLMQTGTRGDPLNVIRADANGILDLTSILNRFVACLGNWLESGLERVSLYDRACSPNEPLTIQWLLCFMEFSVIIVAKYADFGVALLRNCKAVCGIFCSFMCRNSVGIGESVSQCTKLQWVTFLPVIKVRLQTLWFSLRISV